MLVVAFGLAAMIPAYIWGIPHGADLDNHFRFAMPFYDELAGGNLFPGWLAESNNGFGDTRFRFYPPFLYYMLAAMRAVIGDWYAATLAVFTLFSVLGCVGTYLWVRRSYSRATAIAATAVFALLPYHFTQFYQASLLAEYAAMSLLPFAFLFIDRLSTRDTRPLPNILGLGFAFALIVITHIPTTIVSGIGLGVYALASTNWRENKRSLIYCAAGMAVAMLLSSFFWWKVVTEIGWIQAGYKVTSEYYDYRNNFLFSPFSLTNLNVFFGSMVAALTVGIFLPAMMLLHRIFGRKERSTEFLNEVNAENSAIKALRASIIVAAFAFFMTTDLSRPVWAIVPKLPDIQFPFRWLSVASVAICPAAAVGIIWLINQARNKKIRPLHLAAGVIAVLAAGYSVWELSISSDFLKREAFLTRIEDVRGGPSFPDWLPVGAAQLKDLTPMSGPIDANGRDVISSQINSHHRRFVFAAGPATDARIRAYWYPNWQATITTDEGTTKADTKKAEDGTLLVAIPAESCELELIFR